MSALTLFILLTAVVISEQQSHNHSDRSEEHLRHLQEYGRNVFEETAQQVINADRKVQELCGKNNNGATKAIFESNRYVLKTPFVDFTKEDVAIEVRLRTLYIKALQANPERKYTEIRELPTIVNTKEGAFKVQDGILEIVFPYKSASSCGAGLDVDVINVTALV